jgi:2-hydroxychromene-2-carboxylate isomerase
MTMHADLFWSFRSPYSYLATRRYVALTEAWDVEIVLRPVYPLAVRQPDFFARSHPNWLPYTVADVMRLARYLDIPFVPPRPDPIVQDMATRQISAEQPYIYRLTRLGQVAARRGRSLAFCDAVSRLIWGGVENWHEGAHLAAAAASCHLDLAEMDAEASMDVAAIDAEIADSQAALESAGHWGVPTLVVDGEPFFGQDRIDLALWRMQQMGLTAR